MSKYHCCLATLFVLTLSAMITAQIPAVGTKAPAFSAQSHTLQKTSFPPQGSWSVLAFYPRASTPG